MIGITSGFFAPLHQGHLEYLSAALDYCIDHGDNDIELIVIINNDEQVRLKGSIPFLDEDTRYDIVSNLYMVDTAFVARDVDNSVSKTLEWIVKRYKQTIETGYELDDFYPVYFFNSGDRQNANPKEHAVCEKYDIQEVFLDLPKVNSSSEILDRVGEEWHKRYEESKTPLGDRQNPTGLRGPSCAWPLKDRPRRYSTPRKKHEN